MEFAVLYEALIRVVSWLVCSQPLLLPLLSIVVFRPREPLEAGGDDCVDARSLKSSPSTVLSTIYQTAHLSVKGGNPQHFDKRHLLRAVCPNRCRTDSGTFKPGCGLWTTPPFCGRPT